MAALLERYFPNVVAIQDEFVTATIQTLYMVFWTSLIAGILGILLGIVLVVTRPNGILENRPLFEFLDKVINVVRSIPFIILLTLLGT